jgi:Transmembrane family 220, helix
MSDPIERRLEGRPFRMEEVMRYLNGFLCVLLALFTIVQYNDPDAILWILIYGLPTVWAGFAAYRPRAFAHNQLFLSLLGLNILAVGAGAIYMWPSEVSTWWDQEEVREGLGLIITTVALLLMAFTLWRTQRRQIQRFAT